MDKMLNITDKVPAKTQQQPMQFNDALVNMLAGLGTARDKRSHSFYGLARRFSWMQLDAIYRTSALAKKTINAPVEDMTRKWVQLMFDSDLEQDQVIEKAAQAFALKEKVTEALKWARLYGGAAIMLITDTPNLSVPLDVKSIPQGGLINLLVLDKTRFEPVSTLDPDPRSPTFGRPMLYQLADTSTMIHASRLVMFHGERLPYQSWLNNGYWDDSVLQHVYEALLNFDDTTANIASLVFEASVDVIKVKELDKLFSTEDGENFTKKRWRTALAMMSNVHKLLIDANEEYTQNNRTFTEVVNVLNSFKTDYAMAADIPVTRLWGTSATGLNATGDNDIRNYYDMLSSKQETDLRLPLQTLYEAICASTLGSVPDDFHFVFKPLWQPTAVDKANIEKTNADRDSAYYQMKVLQPSQIAKQLKEDGVYANLTDEDIKALEDEEKDEAENPTPQPVPPQFQNPDGSTGNNPLPDDGDDGADGDDLTPTGK